MLCSNKQLIQRFECTAADTQRPEFKPNVIKLAATIDGGALTYHKGFIIYGIKFVQKEFVNLLMGRHSTMERKEMMMRMVYNPYV